MREVYKSKWLRDKEQRWPQSWNQKPTPPNTLSKNFEQPPMGEVPFKANLFDPVTATEFHLIGKETGRGWEQAEDISTLLPSLKRYESNNDTAGQLLRECLRKCPSIAYRRKPV